VHSPLVGSRFERVPPAKPVGCRRVHPPENLIVTDGPSRRRRTPWPLGATPPLARRASGSDRTSKQPAVRPFRAPIFGGPRAPETREMRSPACLGLLLTWGRFPSRPPPRPVRPAGPTPMVTVGRAPAPEPQPARAPPSAQEHPFEERPALAEASRAVRKGRFPLGRCGRSLSA